MIESIPRVWRERKYKYRLIGSKCKRCGKIFYPPRKVCLKCGSRELEEVFLARRGKVLSYTVIRSPPTSFIPYKPYIVALIQLDDGTKIFSQLTDVEPEEVKTGMKVEAVFRKYKEQSESGIIEYGIKFIPVIEE
ncbi:MAG TPA: Zn-ribbon domain-containing OB-fold protein [Thermoprotei archaeon]|nr:Zn-ribbon domain-containing OB-fold protein [Thermoprotei archaeon]